MTAAGWPAQAIDLSPVPGAFEIPLRCRILADSGRYRAVVASALVVDGGIYPPDFVDAAVLHGLMTVQLETRLPVLAGVWPTHHYIGSAASRGRVGQEC